MIADLMEPAFSPGATAILCGAFYVIGKVSERAKHIDWVSWMVGENRRLATALRALYKLAGVPYPTDEELDPEPEPGRWQRFRAWLRAMRRDEPVGTPVVVKPEHDKAPPVDLGFTGPVPTAPVVHSDTSWSEALERGEAIDAAPVTQPIVMPDPGPATVPAQVVAGDTFALILAEHEASMVKLRADAMESIRQMAGGAK